MDQVRRTILAGDLAAGERLPSIRELASLLQLNPLTVGKAYGELERTGLIESRRGMGMYVCAQAPRATDASAPAGVVLAARRLVLESAQAGRTRQQTLRTVEECWRELAPGGGAASALAGEKQSVRQGRKAGVGQADERKGR